MANSVNLPKGIRTLTADAPVESKYFNIAGTPYTNTAQVISEIVEAIRHKGLTVAVANGASIQEYWFKDGVADLDLIVKSFEVSVWTKTGDNIRNNNVGDIEVQLQSNKKFKIVNSLGSEIGYIDNNGNIRSYGSVFTGSTGTNGRVYGAFFEGGGIVNGTLGGTDFTAGGLGWISTKGIFYNADKSADANPRRLVDLAELNTRQLLSERGVANGYIPSNASNKIDLQYLPDAILGQLVYGGGVNATTAVATLTNNAKTKLGIGFSTITLTNNTAIPSGYVANEGIFYIATTAGTFATITFEVGDWLISIGSAWTKIDNTDAVSSVAGRTGVVVLTKSDVGLGNVDNTSDANKPISTATQTALDLKADITEYPETTYSQTITYSATTAAPSGGLTANYRATRIGKCVSVRFNFKNAVAGTGVTQAIIPFPSALPSPSAITDFNTNGDFIGTGSGVFQTGANNGVASRVVLRKVTGGYEIHLIASTASYISGILNFQYFID